MALRGKKPEDRQQRLKLLMYGPAGVGKTTAAIQMPRPYVIDTERGSVHYGSIIEKSGGAVFESTSINDVIAEVRALMIEKHDYLTLVIDPITTVFNEALDEGERSAGTEFGRHYGYANKLFKRLCGLLTAIDMNVIITAHSKNEYGQDMKVIGTTFDGYKKLDYIFDLAVQLERDAKNGKRYGVVMKTRLAEFPDRERFDWSYEEIARRFGKDRLETGSKAIALATADQVREFNMLLKQITPEQQKALGIDKALSTVDDVADLTTERIAKGITIINNYLRAQPV
jgi:hypothetical protein